MKFEFRNLGELKEADIELNKLTLVCGENNTGKSYLLKGISAFYVNITQDLDMFLKSELVSNSPTTLEKYKNWLKNEIDLREQNFTDKFNELMRFDSNAKLLIDKVKLFNEINTINDLGDFHKKLSEEWRTIYISSERAAIVEFKAALNNFAIESFVNSDDNDFFDFITRYNLKLMNMYESAEKRHNNSATTNDLIQFMVRILGGELTINKTGIHFSKFYFNILHFGIKISEMNFKEILF